MLYEQCGSRLVQRKQSLGRLLEQRHERQRQLPLIVLIIRQHLCLRYRRLLCGQISKLQNLVHPCYRRFCCKRHVRQLLYGLRYLLRHLR